MELKKLPKTINEAASVQKTTRHYISQCLIIIGTLVLCYLPVGIFSTAHDIYLMFDEVKLSGTGDPKLMAGKLSSALVTTVLGMVSTAISSTIFAVALLVGQFYRPWVYFVTLLSGILSLIFFPVGTISSLIIFVVLNKRKPLFFEGETWK